MAFHRPCSAGASRLLFALAALLGADALSASLRPFETSLVDAGSPLRAVPAESAAATVLREGVARVDRVLEAEACSALRSHILELRESTGSLDNRYVPGTRLRFGDARDIEMAAIQRRTDVLLPLDDALVKRALCTAARMLPVEEAAACLPRDDDDGAELLGLELVECGALVAWSGAPHQPLHADFKRLPTAGIAATDTPADGEKPALSGRLSRPAPADERRAERSLAAAPADGETPALSGRLSRPTAASIDGATPPAPRRAPPVRCRRGSSYSCTCRTRPRRRTARRRLCAARRTRTRT